VLSPSVEAFRPKVHVRKEETVSIDIDLRTELTLVQAPAVSDDSEIKRDLSSLSPHDPFASILEMFAG